MKLIYPKSVIKIEENEFPENDRTLLAVGKEVVKRIARLKFGIIGVGGLGILALEQLARLGVNNYVVIDNDIIDQTNLNRYLSATMVDVKLKMKKTTIAARLLYNINPNIELEIINGDILKEENQNQFKSCDIIFGCSDSVAVRLAANHLCLANGIIYIDLGCGVRVSNSHMSAAGGQVIPVIPGRGFCIRCCGLFDLGKAAMEFADSEEYKRQRAMGYVEGANIHEPSVYSLNMMIASQAVWIMMRLVSYERLEFDGIFIDGLNFRTYPWSEKEMRNLRQHNNCIECGDNGFEFRGDGTELLIKEHNREIQVPANNPVDDNYNLLESPSDGCCVFEPKISKSIMLDEIRQNLPGEVRRAYQIVKWRSIAESEGLIPRNY